MKILSLLNVGDVSQRSFFFHLLYHHKFKLCRYFLNVSHAVSLVKHGSEGSSGKYHEKGGWHHGGSGSTIICKTTEETYMRGWRIYLANVQKHMYCSNQNTKETYWELWAEVTRTLLRAVSWSVRANMVHVLQPGTECMHGRTVLVSECVYGKKTSFMPLYFIVHIANFQT